MMKYLLAATAAIAMVASAAAQTMDDTNNNDKKTYWLECSVTTTDKDSDPSYKVNVYIDAKKDLFDGIVFTTRSGKQYDRAVQYEVDNNSHTPQGANLWIGHLKKNPAVYKSGTLGEINGKTYYKEWVMDKNKKLIPVLESVCHYI